MIELVQPASLCDGSGTRLRLLSLAGSFDCSDMGSCFGSEFLTKMIPINVCWSDFDNIPLEMVEAQSGHYLAKDEIARFAGHCGCSQT